MGGLRGTPTPVAGLSMRAGIRRGTRPVLIHQRGRTCCHSQLAGSIFPAAVTGDPERPYVIPDTAHAFLPFSRHSPRPQAPGTWRGTPRLQRITARYVASASTRAIILLSGRSALLRSAAFRRSEAFLAYRAPSHTAQLDFPGASWRERLYDRPSSASVGRPRPRQERTAR